MFKEIGLILSGLLNIAFACTSFGAITSDGTIIGKNRDYFYGRQDFVLMSPLKQFVAWYANPYQHKNTFYALISSGDVKFGVNELGLTAIEEDPLYSQNTDNRMYYQPYTGYSEGMILYGILQNFTTVKEMIPYLNDIFSTAAPNFYQIADSNSILTVEVAYGANQFDTKRQFTYKIINKNRDYFTHTNYYLSPEFESLNMLQENKNLIIGAANRLNKITNYVRKSNDNYSNALNWYLDTTSDITNTTDKNWCQTTSIFRSNLQNLTKITREVKTNSVYGTVSSFIVQTKNNIPMVSLRIIDTIDTLKNGNQKITYRELVIPLKTLFASDKLNYTQKTFIRPAPTINGVCN